MFFSSWNKSSVYAFELILSKWNFSEMVLNQDRLVVARGSRWGFGDYGEGGQKVPTSSYEMK